MKQTLRFLFSFFLVGANAFAQPPTEWRIQFTGAKSIGGTRSELAFQRVNPANGQVQSVTLVDNDGIATLAATQLALVEAVRQSAEAKNPDTTVESILGRNPNAILVVQRRALENLQRTLETLKAAQAQGGNTVIVANPRLTIDGALAEIQAALLVGNRPTLRDVDALGRLVKKLLPNAGPYSATYSANGQSQTYSGIRLADPRPREAFLAGSFESGIYETLGRAGVSKSHVYVAGDLTELARQFIESILPRTREEQAPAPKTH